MNPMDTAPKDGTRILLKYRPEHFRRYTKRDVEEGLCTKRAYQLSRSAEHYLPDGDKWEECLWDGKRWTCWCGISTVHSSLSIIYPLGWLPRPEDV